MGGYEEMKCNKCNTENPDNSRFCMNCGNSLQDQADRYEVVLDNVENELKKVPFYKKTWFVILVCIFFPPIGIALLWVYKKPEDVGVRIFWTIILGVFSFSILVNQDDSSNVEKKEPVSKNSEVQKSVQEEQEDSDDDGFVSKLSDYIDKSVAEKANDIIINQIGFSEVEFREKMGETTNFEISLDGIIAVLTASDDVYRIFIPDSDYTFYEDSVVKMTAQQFKDVTIDSYEQTAYYSIAKEIVESYLKSPKSADFPTLMLSGNDIAMAKSGDIVAVQSYVDAENSFGAEVRSEYIVEFRVIDLDSFSYEVIYVNIDGEESGTYIEI